MTTCEELDSFHQFAAQRLSKDASAATLDELFMEWHDGRSRAEMDESIHHGLADVDAGRCEPADIAMETIRRQFGFAQE